MTNTPVVPNREYAARRRAGLRLSWILHAAAFLVINLGLATVAAASGHRWVLFPMLGWGLGLAIHGAVVLLAGPAAGLHRRLLNQERTRLARAPL